MKKVVVFLVSVLCSHYFGAAASEEINVDLQAYKPSNKDMNLFKKFQVISEDKTVINIKNINDAVDFFVIQVHSYLENLTLSYNSTILLHSHITGTNIGLVYGYEEDTATFYLFRNIKVKENARILLVISLYDYYDPVPGGCNLSFNTVVAPYQVVSYDDETITVNSQAPSAYSVSCDHNKIQVDMFHLFLSEYDNSDSKYFEGVSRMLTVDSIRKHGTLVPEGDEYFKYRRLYSSYRGTGEVFAIVATYRNRSSAYVPAVTYGCDVTNWDTRCIGPVTSYWKFICALLLIFGMFACFLGHKYFKLTLYLMGFTFGVFVTYFAISFEQHLSVQEITITSLIIGFFYGIVWLFIWWKYGVPLLSVNLAFLLGGVLTASIVFNAGLADLAVYHNGLNYWITFFCIILVCLILWTPVATYGHIFACSFLGSYAVITALNYYIGGHLQYIIINTYRRAIVKHFNNAVIKPPFQSTDLILTILWAILLAFGCFVQWRDQKGKPPFPPHRSGVILADALPQTERTPLLNQLPHIVPPQYV